MSRSDDFRTAFFQANPREMGGRSTHTVELWPAEHAESEWAQARPEVRERYWGSSMQTGSPIGSISWHHQTGEIKGIYVEREHQRQGHATAMLQHARNLAEQTRGVVRPRHSSFRTESGEAWARSTGDRLPKRVTYSGTIGEPQPAGG